MPRVAPPQGGSWVMSPQGGYFGVQPPQGVGAAFSPSDIAGLAVWHDLNDITTLWQDSARTTPVTANSDPIGRVDDKSGGGHPVLQATGANRPLYKTAIIGGKPVMRFDGVNDSLSTGLFAIIAQPSTMFIVYNPGSATRPFDTASTPGRQFLNSSAPTLGIWAGASLNTASTASTDVIQIGIFNGASSKVYLNGGAAAASGNAGANGMDEILYCSDGNSFFNDEIGELLVYGSALSVTDINLVGAYLGTKWGIAWTSAS